MKRLIATIILAIIVMITAGCDITYHEVGFHHGYAPRAVIITRPSPHWHGHHYPYGHHHGGHWRGY